MKTYKIQIREILTLLVEIEANSSKEATDLIYEDYKKEKYILDENNLSELNFIDISEESELSKIKRLVNEVIDYMWKHEKHHFEESDMPKNHIFRVLRTLKDSL